MLWAEHVSGGPLMIATTKLSVLATGAAGAVVVGVGPSLDSEITLIALVAAGAGAVASGIWHLVHSRATDR